MTVRMEELINIISKPWPWYISGPSIALVMFLLLYFGNSFGVSANFRTICSISGAGKHSDFFKFDWRSQIWNLVFIIGALVGGYIAQEFLTPERAAHISEKTITELQDMGINNPGQDFVPREIFSWETLFTIKGMIMVILGGFLVGFGTRYAGGCTSGHAISGLSDLQLPSLIAVIGFFIGGLFVTYLVLPYLLTI